MKTEILVLGAGAGGLSAAYSLLKAGKEVTIIEKENFCGGLIRPVVHENFILDFGYKEI